MVFVSFENGRAVAGISVFGGNGRTVALMSVFLENGGTGRASVRKGW